VTPGPPRGPRDRHAGCGRTRVGDVKCTEHSTPREGGAHPGVGLGRNRVVVKSGGTHDARSHD
jgi:hypothetical protein